MESMRQSVAEALSGAEFRAYTDASFRGLHPDVVVVGSDGKVVTLNIKAVAPTRPSVARAAQALVMHRQLGAQDAFAVYPQRPTGPATHGLVGVADVLPAVEEALASRSAHSGARPTVTPVGRTVFVAMPFAPHYDDVFYFGMRAAAESAKITTVRVDHEAFSGDVVGEIRQLLRSSSGVIADVSESRPNVLYELGYGHALGKPTIQICNTPLSEIPFDIRNDKTIGYERGRTKPLQRQLAEWLETVL